MKNIKLASLFCVVSFLTVGCSGGGSGGSSDSSSYSASVVLGAQTNPLKKGMFAVGKPVVVGTKLIVPDQANHRILIYNSIPTSSYQQADIVLGQSNFISGLSNQGLFSPSANSLYSPVAVTSDGTNLVVSERDNNRVMIWNAIPTTNNQAADVVLGQATFLTNDFLSASNSNFNGPHGVAIVGTKLFVADPYNNRIMVWNTIPTTNNQAASFVLGQPDFTTTNTGGDTGSVSDIASNGTILVGVGNQMTPKFWNSIPTTTNQAPDFDLGNDPTASNAWNGVLGVSFAGTKLVITGDNYSGTYIWNTIPTSAATHADFQVGSNTGSTSSLNFVEYGLPYSNGSKLFLADGNRLLIWSSMPANSTTPADVVLGQPNMTTNGVNGIATTSSSLNYAADLVFVGSKLVVSDSYNRRVLIWNSVPTSNAQAANVVIGQADFVTSVHDTTSVIMKYPSGVATDGTRLFVSDSNSNRILIYNTVPTSSGVAADHVIGQPDFTSNSNGTSSTQFDWPAGIATNGTIFAVADSGNNRVLIWNSIPTSNATPADVVIGQANFTSNGYATSATEMNWPEGVKIVGTKLLVNDSGNGRILVWNTIPTSNGQAADVVIGQPDFTTYSPGTTSSRFGVYGSMANVDSSNRLYVSDYSNNRVLVYNTIPTTNGAAADAVIGQSNFTTGTPGEATTKLNLPWGLAVKDSALWVCDVYNSRILQLTQ